MTDDAWPKRPDPPASEEEGEDWQSEKHEAAEAVAVDDTPAPLDDFVEEASAEHAAGEVNVPDGYAMIEGSSRGERRSVAVVVIGGTSLLGGRGGVVLTTMAAFVLTLIDDVVSAQNLSVWVGAAADAGLLLVIVGTRSFIELRRSIER